MDNVGRGNRPTRHLSGVGGVSREEGAGAPLGCVAEKTEGRCRAARVLIDIWCRLVHNGAMNTKLSPPSPTIRLTIPVSQEVHEVFTRMAYHLRRPLGSTMAEWLQDTLEAAEAVTRTLEEVSPRHATHRITALAQGYAHQAEQVMESMKRGPGGRERAGGPSRTPGRASKGTSPVSNTGGKVSGENTPKSSKRGPKV